MLSIKGYDKVIGMDFHSDRKFHYVVDRIEEHKDYYVFVIRNLETAFMAGISLHRHSKTEFRGERTYTLLWNGRDSNVGVTAGYIKERGVMKNVLKSVVDNNNF